jgi:UDP-N-acetylmuramoyl-L-alanyl-D-glutamate--2,6-diaminopimelate ligase
VRRALGPLCDRFYDHPSRSLRVLGVTGTNGKTTTTYLLAEIFRAGGHKAAVIGTLGGPRTTPEAPMLQARLAELRDDGVEAVAMEVSSHALAEHRVDALTFAAAIFTNLSQDHLDYHRDMSAYFEAKAQLFNPSRSSMAVVNRDDQWGRRLIKRLEAAGAAVFPFSLEDASDLQIGMDGSRWRWHGVDLHLRLAGRFNIANALAAAATARVLGLDDRSIAEGLAAVHSVNGRFEPIDAGQSFTVLVDYAHTPDGLEQVLTAARELAPGRVIVVFGCGGDRDRSKRPLMGSAASRLSDLAVLTSDNPRSEDPEAIIAEVAAGVAGPGQVLIDVDRARAISTALVEAGPGDIVVIAGKGHEVGQEIGGRVQPFDDADVARSILRRLQQSRIEDARS